jgi:hypothetical protein
MPSRNAWARPAALVLALTLAQAAGAQTGDVQDQSHAGDASAGPLIASQQYSDPQGRFSFTAPLQWARLGDENPDEVTFQSGSGDSMRVTVAPLKVDPQAFLTAYVDTYLGVLAQSFTEVKYLGQRDLAINNRKAVDFVFSARYGNAPVTCHQVVLIEGDNVLYVTFAGFGRGRDLAEQLFLSSLLTFWINPTFGGKSPAPAAAQNGAPVFTIAIPEGWGEQPNSPSGSRQFRPPGGRATSASITTFTGIPSKESPFAAINEPFVQAYTTRLRNLYGPGLSEIQRTSRTTLDGEPAVRFDYAYVSYDLGARKVALVICLREGYLVGVACEAAESGFAVYEKAFENVFSSFKFK